MNITSLIQFFFFKSESFCYKMTIRFETKAQRTLRVSFSHGLTSWIISLLPHIFIPGLKDMYLLGSTAFFVYLLLLSIPPRHVFVCRLMQIEDISSRRIISLDDCVEKRRNTIKNIRLLSTNELPRQTSLLFCMELYLRCIPHSQI